MLLLAFLKKEIWVHLGARIFQGSKVKHKSKIVTFCELAQSIWTYWVATTWCADKYPCLFLLLLLYLITVACILEISLGSCWHKEECMGQRSTIHHNVQLFMSLNNQCSHPMATTRCTNKYPWCISTVCYDYVENSIGSCWRKDILRVKGLAQTTKFNFFCKLVQLLKNIFTNLNCPYQISITIWKFTAWLCIEHEVETATSTRKHWLVYGIYQS